MAPGGAAPYSGPTALVSATAGLFAAAAGSCLPGLLGLALTSWDGVPLFTWNLYVAGYGLWAFVLGAADAHATLRGRTRWIGWLLIPLFAALTLALGLRAAVMGTPAGQGTILVLGVWFVVSLAVSAATIGAGVGLVAIARAVARRLANGDPAEVKPRAAAALVIAGLINVALCAPTKSFAVGIVVAAAGAALAWRSRSPWRGLLAAGGAAIAGVAIAAQVGAVWGERLRLARSDLPACVDSGGNAPALDAKIRALPGVQRAFAVPHDDASPPAIAVYVIGKGGRAPDGAELAEMTRALADVRCRSLRRDAAQPTVRALAARAVTMDVTARLVPAAAPVELPAAGASSPEAQRARLDAAMRAAFAIDAVSIAQEGSHHAPVELPTAGAVGALEVAYLWKGRPLEEAFRDVPGAMAEGDYPVLGALTLDVAPARPAPDQALSIRCLQMWADANVARISAQQRCEKDTDCDCAPDVGSDCGKVTDRATAARLRVLSAERAAAGCPPSACAPTVCAPKCRANRCGE